MGGGDGDADLKLSGESGNFISIKTIVITIIKLCECERVGKPQEIFPGSFVSTVCGRLCVLIA